MTTSDRLVEGTKIHTNVALSATHGLRSLEANINARVAHTVGIVRGSSTWDRHEFNEDVVYYVEHVEGQPNAHYRRNEFNLISMANDFTEGCIMSTYASAKAELEALEEALAKQHGIDSHVRERLMQMDINGQLDEDEPTGAVRAWQEALTTFVNWPEDDVPVANHVVTIPITQRTLPPIITQWDHAKYLDGDYSVYPGHPLTIAYVISVTFPTLADALVIRGDYPEALADVRIPGAGGEVSGAISLLRHLRDGTCTPEQAVKRADDHWRSTTTNGHRDAFTPGQAQADRVKAAHLAEIVGFARGVIDATKEKP